MAHLPGRQAQPVIHQLYAGHQSQALSIPGETDAIEGWLLAFLKGFAQGCLGGCAVGICRREGLSQRAKRRARAFYSFGGFSEIQRIPRHPHTGGVPVVHQEYLRRRKGAISAPKETDLRDDGAEADVRSQASARPASMAGLLQQMGKKGGSGSLKQQAKATAATSPTSSTPTGPPGFLSFVMPAPDTNRTQKRRTGQEHKEYLRRRRQFRGRPQEEQLVCEIASLSRRIDHLPES
eukprot:g13034.t1